MFWQYSRKVFAMDIWSCPTHWFFYKFSWVKDDILHVTFMFKHTWELAASRVSENLCHWKGRYCQLCLTEAGREQQSIKAASAGPYRCSSSLVWFHTAEQGLASVPSCRPAWAEPGGCLHLCVSAVSYPLTPWACNSAPAAAHQMSTSRKPCPDNQVQIMLRFVSPGATSTKYVLHV